MNHCQDTTGAHRIRIFAALMTCGCGLAFLAGCQSLNDNPNNTRVWFPSFVDPGHLNPYHENGYPDGTDPYPDGNIGTSSIQARPQGYDLPRNWNSQITGETTAKPTD